MSARFVVQFPATGCVWHSNTTPAVPAYCFLSVFFFLLPRDRLKTRWNVCIFTDFVARFSPASVSFAVELNEPSAKDVGHTTSHFPPLPLLHFKVKALLAWKTYRLNMWYVSFDAARLTIYIPPSPNVSKSQACFLLRSACTGFLPVTGCYHRWRLTVTSIEMPFAVSQHRRKKKKKHSARSHLSRTIRKPAKEGGEKNKINKKRTEMMSRQNCCHSPLGKEEILKASFAS